MSFDVESLHAFFEGGKLVGRVVLGVYFFGMVAYGVFMVWLIVSSSVARAVSRESAR